MSASNSFENSTLDHLLRNANIANVGDATGLRGSTVAGSLYISLHTTDPGEAGDQTTNEIAYTGYGRIGMGRSSDFAAAAAGASSNSVIITFGLCTAGTANAAWFGIGTAASGAGVLLLSGALSGALAISAGITPSFAIGELDITCE